MLAAGMNDHSGIWAFQVGLPAKSGLTGGTMIIVPNFGGFALYSPKIDKSANSIRAAKFASFLNEKFHLHEYDPVRLAHDFSNNTESGKLVYPSFWELLRSDATHAPLTS